MKHVSIRVSGKVQGVFFRTSAKKHADFLGIKGFVRNELNGDVYIEAEGEENQLQEFLKWCGRGPSQACVDNLDIKDGEVKSFVSFQVSRWSDL
jgi:acylphosphatase